MQQPNSGYDIYFVNSFNTTAWCQKEGDLRDPLQRELPRHGWRHDHARHARYELPHARELRFRLEAQASCNSSAARIIDMTGLTPPATAPGGGTFNQPRTGSLAGSTNYLQWIWIDVTSVTSP